ncbi:MAG: family 43 glycosylhydrolase [Bacteroidetes bacterium]|jgi:hypothetical protein|nr:family 43 glycosylhydrolase [Bacteroidota bacterium]
MSNYLKTKSILFIVTAGILFSGCQGDSGNENGMSDTSAEQDTVLTSVMSDTLNAISEPLVNHMYTADPSAHVFDGRLYIYPSHDYESGIPQDDLGSHFDMQDYHVFSMETVGGEVTDHGLALHVDDVPWADRQMWAPDANRKGDMYYFYFPAKDENGVFYIGAATSDSPTGPFDPQPEQIEGSYSMDPAVYKDTDGEYYMYFGGIWGGQLQRWETGEYIEEDVYPADDEPAIMPRIARMSDDMLSFAEEPKEVMLLDENGDPITAGDNDRRFFEAAWVHKYNDTYYFSYSTGDTHKIVYATGDNPYGPFTYQGVILEPVIGWTNHHSIAEFEGKWYLFYHDTELSGGQTHLRNIIKMAEMTHNPDGSIQTIDPYPDFDQ